MKTVEKRGIIRESTGSSKKPGNICITAITTEELREAKGELSHRIQLLQYMEHIQYCKAEFLPECILGTMAIPVKRDLIGKKTELGYYMDGSRFLLVGDPSVTDEIVDKLDAHEMRSDGTTADVLADFLNILIEEEVPFLQHMEEKLSQIEEGLLSHIPKNFYQIVIRYRRQLLVLHTYYEQLINMSDMIENNHNEMLDSREAQRFTLFGARAERLHDHVEMLREYVLQIREMYQTQIDVSQNHTMNLLAVVTSLFLPLSLLAGWYGMNFTNMPELRWAYSYPVLIFLSAAILVLEIRFFKKKGLL